MKNDTIGWIITFAFFAGIIWFFLGTKDTIGWAILIGLIWLIVIIIKNILRGVNKISDTIIDNIIIRESPTIIQPIKPSITSFDLTNLVKFKVPFPDVAGEWLTMVGDHDKLKKYASLIDSHRSLAEKDALNAISKFENDNKLLIDQQRQIFRRAFQAKSLIKRFNELKNINLSLNNLPKSLQVQMPIKPKYLTPQNLDRQYGLLPSNTGHAIGKAINTGGFGSSGNNLLAAGIAMVALAVHAKTTISKLKRSLEDAKGSINGYCIELNTTVSLLAKSHDEIVNVSSQLKIAEGELISIINDVKQIPSNISDLKLLDITTKDNLLNLYFLILQAEQHGVKKI